MTLNELFEDLAYGELSNLAMCEDLDGKIREEDQPKIIRHVNKGLLALYSRFLMLEKDVLIELVDGITNYHLNKRFAESNWNESEITYPYIKDLGGEPFDNDVIKVLKVFNQFGVELPLNDTECQWSIFTPQSHILQVPIIADYMSLSVLYQAKHPKLRLDKMEDNIILPEVLEPALTAYVAWKVFSNIGSGDAMAKAQEHLAYYESTCNDATENDLVNTSIISSNTRFEKRGWI